MNEIFQVIDMYAQSISAKYSVNPYIFASIYIGAIPFFSLGVFWIIKNYKKKKTIVLPIIFTGFFFISAYLYLLITGENIPWWVYVIIVLLLAYGVYGIFKKVRKKSS